MDTPMQPQVLEVQGDKSQSYATPLQAQVGYAPGDASQAYIQTGYPVQVLLIGKWSIAPVLGKRNHTGTNNMS